MTACSGNNDFPRVVRTTALLDKEEGRDRLFKQEGDLRKDSNHY